jgi:NAD(P)-dependent dehydrogenase (short-subunit alcohol dehydrogenase family)
MSKTFQMALLQDKVNKSQLRDNTNLSDNNPTYQILIITGAAAGIGLATATAALDEGARVFGIDILDAPKTLRENPNFGFLCADLTHNECAKQVVESCTAAFGSRIDGLLNIAGIPDNYSSADSVTDEIWDRCLAINLTAPVRLIREVLPVMREAGKGSIVNTSSKAGLSGAASGVAYTASELVLALRVLSNY